MGFRVNRTGNQVKSEKTAIGEPSDGLWSDGYFDHWKKDTALNEALDDISEAFASLAPPKASMLTGASLSPNITLYTGKLPKGLDEVWYSGGKTPGSTISKYATANSIRLTTPFFRSGKKENPDTYGVLKLIADGQETSVYDMSNGTGGNGVLNVPTIETYNTLWSRANANATIQLDSEGRHTYELRHSEAGNSSVFELWHDTERGPIEFEVNPSVSMDTEVLKHLSGVGYLTIGTKLKVSYKAASGIFSKVYHPDSVSKISCTGMVALIVNPADVPNYDDTFEVIDQIAELTVANQATNTPSLSVQLSRPETSISAQTALSKRICTYGIVSTNTSDNFYDEDKRLVIDTNTKWDSVQLLTNGNAQVRNGVLEYGSADYSGKTGPQEYQRKLTKAAASTGMISLAGLNVSNISPFGTGDVNVLLRLDNSNLWFDTARAVGDKNGDGSGNSRSNSIGCRVSGSGSTVNWSFGTNSTAFNNSEYRLVIIFRTNKHSITSITSA